jgi:hypothetical protein
MSLFLIYEHDAPIVLVALDEVVSDSNGVDCDESMKRARADRPNLPIVGLAAGNSHGASGNWARRTAQALHEAFQRWVVVTATRRPTRPVSGPAGDALTIANQVSRGECLVKALTFFD